MKAKSRWRKEPEEHNYPSAESYLCLLCDERTAARLVKKLVAAQVQQFKAKDIFRASGLPLLPITNIHVREDQRKLLAGQKISPLLLVRHAAGGPLIIADGYHRICAVYAIEEDSLIPVRSSRNRGDARGRRKKRS